MSAAPDLPSDLSLADYFLDARVREGRGGRIALRLPQASLDYRRVQGLANAVAAALLERGVDQEERVILALPDGAAFVAAFFGVLKLGAVVVMVNPDQGPAEIAGVSACVRPRAILTDGAHRAAFRQHAVLRRRGVLAVLDEDAAGELALDGDPLPPLADFDNVPTHRDDPAIWLFSGGTTGRPKAVVQSHGAFVNTTVLYAQGALGYRPDDVTLSVPKLYFGYATGSNLLFPFAAGASAVLFPEPPTAEVLFDRIRRFRPTILINVPTVVGRMVAHPQAARQDLSCLRFATSAGEALPASLYERWKATFGVELLDGLGTAEMWHVFITNTPQASKPGTLGRVVPGFEVRICDDDGRAVADGEVGRLWVRGRSRALGYWQDLERTCECFRGPWFVGGDLVRRDAGGFISYCGRSDDALKVGGRWLMPKEVESCLLEHPAVAECAVIGAADRAGLLKPYAFVVASRPAAGLEEALRTHVLERLEPYKHPRRVILTDALPRTHLGKVDRGALRRRLEADPG